MMQPGRLQALDWLRALAILLVLGRHLFPCPAEESVVAHWVTTLWERGGWIGVDLFFVLSGFLVSGLLFKEHERHGEISIPRFYLRRGVRIYPPFFFFLLASTILWVAFKKPLNWKELLVDAVFLQNYLPGFWGHTWSLAVEEHFYLLLPLVFALLVRRRKRNDPLGALLLIFPLVALACLWFRLQRAPVSTDVAFVRTHLRLDSLFFGVLLAYLYHCRPAVFQAISRQRALLAFVALCCLFPPFLFELKSTPWFRTYGYSVLFIGSGALLVLALSVKPTTASAGRFLAWFGSHSYSLYLWHFLVARITPATLKLLGWEENGWFVYAPVYLFGSIAAGVVSSVLLEKPVLVLRDRWVPSRSGELQPVVVEASGFSAPGARELATK